MKLKTSAVRSLLVPCGAGLLCCFAQAGMAQTLVANPCDPRNLYPGKIVYDANQGVCWAADANLAGRPAMRAALAVSGVNPNGTMDFQTAQNWVAALNATGYLGHSDWQIPVTPLNDSTCDSTGTNGGSFSAGCTGSTMGNLYSLSLNLNYPASVAPGFGVPASQYFQDLKLSYYWTQAPGSGGQEVYAFTNQVKGGVTTTFPYYYVLPMVPGPIGGAPHCPSASGVLPYTTGPAAGKAVLDCATNYTWPSDANLAALEKFGIAGDVVIVSDQGVTLQVPAIDHGAMLYNTATEWIAAMQTTGYAGSHAWELPPDHTYLQQFASDLGLMQGDFRLQFTGNAGAFQNLQPFYYWGCQEQRGVTESPCSAYAPADSQQMQWTFNFDDGFQGTAATSQEFFLMVYFPAPPPPACSNPMACGIQAGGYWSDGQCQ
jgi:hypothetical protein